MLLHLEASVQMEVNMFLSSASSFFLSSLIWAFFKKLIWNLLVAYRVVLDIDVSGTDDYVSICYDDSAGPFLHNSG